MTTSNGTALPDLANLTILVVDDDDDTRQIFSTMLRYCGAGVFDAASAPNARRWLSENRANVIVLDMQLPGETGAALLSWLRAQPSERGGNTSVIVVTAHPESFPAVAMDGYAAYHQKPVLPDALCRTIGDLMGRHAAG
jgi:CheY-like chemotaxis protein